MAIHYEDDSVTLHHGDALAVAREMASGAVDCIVTSPPYFGLRDYGIEGQYGLEESPAEYVETMRGLFAELRRVLADDGGLWLNLGDSYVGGGGYSPGAPSNAAGSKASRSKGLIGGGPSSRCTGLAAKNLLGIPWRVAFALQEDGWILRNAIVWHKPNAMPESVTDRLSTRYEMLFMFSTAPKCWFDLDVLRTLHAQTTVEAASRARISVGANPGDVWSIPTQPFAAGHFAVMALELAERCVQAGCKPDGTVLDPFSGSGTTGLAAAKHGRRYVGIDLNADYLDLSLRTRLRQPGLDFGEVS